jgi:hypothetical protein
MGLVSALQTVKSRIGAAWAALVSGLFAFWKAFDIRDVFLFGGLGMLGYGLYLYQPWIAFSTSGALLMIIGYIMRGPK